MSTPEKQVAPLTRKQLRALRETGSIPVTPDAGAGESALAAPVPLRHDATAPWAPAGSNTPAAPPTARLPRASVPVPLHTAPVPDASVDLHAAPLTRRRARQQERIRTASVPVITPDMLQQEQQKLPASTPPSWAPAGARGTATDAGRRDADTTDPRLFPVPSPTPAGDDEAAAPLFASPVAPTPQPEVARSAPAAVPETPVVGVPTAASAEPVDAFGPAVVSPERPAAPAPASPADAPASPAPSITRSPWPTAPAASDTPAPTAPSRRGGSTVNPMLGARLLVDESATAESEASFEQLLSRDTSSFTAVTTSSTLIMTPAKAASLIAPIAGTGEVLVTGTYILPDGLGSTGRVAGTADGKEADAVLIDGELPAHSSPTPLAASSAVSTIKPAAEVIQPPVKEKTSKLMVTLAITAGVLAVSLLGVLGYALISGSLQ